MIHDVRYAIRTSLRRPAFATLVVVTLGLGIGANTAMFSIVDSVLIEPLPFARPDELVYVYGAFKGGNEASVSPPDFLDYRARQTVFSSFAARTFGAAVLDEGGEPERVLESTTTANFFATLGVKPFLGRDFLPAEERGSHDVAILSHGLWQRRFAGRPDVVGTAARIDGRPHTIVGVMPPVLDAMFDTQVWRPVPFGTSGTTVRRFHYLRGLGRLAPGVTLAGAQRQLDVIAKQLERAYPENETWKLRLVPYRETVVGDVGRTLVVLLCAVGLVLLIACGNVASLMLARATTRTGEIAVRTALGASRWRLLRQLLTEGFTLGLTAGVAGLAVAYFLVRGVRALGAGIVPRLAEIGIDRTALLFTFALSLVTSLLFGLAPALRAARSDVAAALKSAGKGAGGGRRAHTRHVLVVAQVAVSFVLLIVAGLLIRSLGQLQSVQPGFDPGGVFTAEITLPPRYEARADIERFWATFTERLQGISGVESTAATTLLPLRGGGDTYFYVDGRPPASDAERMNAEIAVVTDDYFEAMRIAVRGGRTFGTADRAEAPGVMVINEGLARKLFPGATSLQSALGKRLVVDFGTPFVGEIVGVVNDVRAYGQANAAPDTMYFSLRQPAGFWVGRMRLVVRARGDETAVAPHVRAVLHQLEPDVPLASAESMNEILAGSVSDVRFRTRLLASFAAAALLLAVIGLYGVLAYSVTQRTRELGIRMALGARSAEVFQLVAGEGMLLVAAGVALGLGLSLAATRLVTSMLFEVGQTDVRVFVVVTLTLLGAGLAACALPARRATSVSAMDSLRSE